MLTLVSALMRARRHFAHRPAFLTDDGRQITWAAHCDEVSRLAGALVALGLKPGDRFAILAANSLRQATLIHAGYWMGAVAVPINTRLAPAEIAQILDDSQPAYIWAGTAALPILEMPELSARSDRVIDLEDSTGDALANSYSALLASAEPVDVFEADEDSPAILLYTGGTTGRGKGVALSHRNVVSNGLQVGLALSVTDTDRMLHVAPMFHSADLLGTAVTLAGGSHAYLATPTPESFVDALVSMKITYTMIPPTILQQVLAHDVLAQRDLTALRIFISGGAHVPLELLQKTQRFLSNGSMVHGFGLTETSPILTMMHYSQVFQSQGPDSSALSSVGRPLAGVDTRILDSTGRDVPTGETGELVVRGPNVATEYLNQPEMSANAFKNGWFCTGDIGSIDSDGFLSIVDRKKDMIITGGENVYSAEVEAVLRQHPQISDAAVIGVPDDTYGEAVFAILVAAGQTAPSIQSVIDFARQRIGGYKIPRQMVFVDELPKNALGKILKAELRARYGAA
ncbi:MAG: AMP-binding protein [Pseudomonadota bacterium]|nr:AMP-binding protein [Pseudomonadota bacterium]